MIPTRRLFSKTVIKNISGNSYKNIKEFRQQQVEALQHSEPNHLEAARLRLRVRSSITFKGKNTDKDEGKYSTIYSNKKYLNPSGIPPLMSDY